MNNRNLTIVAVLLLLALIGAIVWGAGKSGEVKAVEAARQEVVGELEELNKLKDQLAADVDALTLQYEAAAADNVELKGSLEAAQGELARARAAVSRAKKTNANDKEVAYQMSQQIQDLVTVRADLERSITVVQAQNDSLRSRTTVLENQLSTSRNENASLARMNQNMQSEINQLTLDNFKATAFRVEPLNRRGSKQTAKGGRVRRVAVSFDLAEVPAEYQGVRPLYLVIVDESGTPVTSEKTLPTNIKVAGQSLSIMPIEVKEMNIEESQRIDFNHELDDKLSAGYYQAKVFTDVGLLGASSFRLR